MKSEDNLILPILLKIKKKIYEDKNFYLKKYKDKFYLFSKKTNLIILVSSLNAHRNLNLKFYIDSKFIISGTYSPKSQYYNVYLEDAYDPTFSTYESHVITFIEQFCNQTIFSVLDEFNLKDVMDVFTNYKYNITDCVPFFLYLDGRILKHFKLFSFIKDEYVLLYQNKVYYGIKKGFSNFFEQNVHNIPYDCRDFFNRYKKFLHYSNIFFYNDINYQNFAFLTNHSFSKYNKENLLLLSKEKVITFSYNNSIQSREYEIERCFIKHMSDMIIDNYSFKSELVSKNIIKENEDVKHEHISMFELINY